MVHPFSLILLGLAVVPFLGCRTIHNLPGVGPQLGDLFPTKDRYERTIEAPLSLDRVGSVAEAEFVPPYRGGYIVSIARVGSKEEQRALAWHMHDAPRRLAVKLQLFQDGEIKFEQDSEPHDFGLYFWEHAGFQFGGFECPQDIEYGKMATLRVEVLTPDAELESDFGPFVVFVRKVSDW